MGAARAACDDQECGFGHESAISGYGSGDDGVRHADPWVRFTTSGLTHLFTDRCVRSLYSTFITPWADSSAAHTVEPDFHLPACYNVAPPPPGPTKAAAFSDETLFFMFYSSPRDALQEVAAQEL